MYPEDREVEEKLAELARRLLINIDADGIISMHDAVVDMALSIMKKVEIAPAVYRMYIEGWRGQNHPLSLNLVRPSSLSLHLCVCVYARPLAFAHVLVGREGCLHVHH